MQNKFIKKTKAFKITKSKLKLDIQNYEGRKMADEEIVDHKLYKKLKEIVI